jgi:hypothetical protein
VLRDLILSRMSEDADETRSQINSVSNIDDKDGKSEHKSVN